MVEFGNSLDHPDEEFDDFLGILDFPIDDCLEEGEIVEDWDISSAQCLGPIPYDMLMEPPMISNEELDSPNLFPRPVAPIAGAPEQKQLLEHVHAQSQASVLESSGGKSLSIKSDNAIPVRRRSKRVRHSGINPRLLAAHELSTSKQTSNASSSSKESRKSLIQQPVAMDLMRISPNYVDNSLNVSDHARQTASEPCPEVVKKCAHCQSTKTPQWREGPLGPLTLCNACGVRYRSGRLFPEYGRAASPTFVSSQHSNSHKKVVAMRHEANLLKFKIKIPRVPEGEQLGKHAIADTSSSRPIAGTPKHVDTTCLLVPRLIPTPRVPEQKQVAKHVQIAGVPERKQVAEHVDNSSSRIRPQIAGTPKHVDSPCSLVPRLIAGVPEQKQPAKPVQIAGVNEQKHLGKHVDTSCSLIPPRAHSGKSREQKHHVERMQLAKRKLLADYADGTSQNKLAKTKVQQESRAPLLESSLKYELRRAGGKPPLSPCRKVRIMNMKKCAHCQSTRTPKWREGPLGPGTLCNACGVRYQSGRLLPQHRPEDSPTLVQMTTKHVKVPPPLLIFE